MNNQPLSPEAEKLIHLTHDKHGHQIEDINIGDIITAHPELISGLQEFTDYCKNMGKIDSRENTPNTTGHNIQKIAKKILKSGINT